MPEWLTIEVFDGEVPASGWRRAHENDLVEAAVTNGVLAWDWHTTRWGVVLELAFADDDRLERYRDLPVVRAALDAVPDRVHGLLLVHGSHPRLRGQGKARRGDRGRGTPTGLA